MLISLLRYAWEMIVKGVGEKVAPGAEGIELATSTKKAKKNKGKRKFSGQDSTTHETV
jgi:hypothetical protein